jgi:hypothetical protein
MSEATIDRLYQDHGDNAYHLETRGMLERWAHPSESGDPDGDSTWFCSVCGDQADPDSDEPCSCM